MADTRPQLVHPSVENRPQLVHPSAENRPPLVHPLVEPEVVEEGGIPGFVADRWEDLKAGAGEEIQRQLYGASFLLPEEQEQARRAKLRDRVEPPDSTDPGILETGTKGLGSTLPYIAGGLGAAGLTALAVGAAPVVATGLAVGAGLVTLGTFAMGMASSSGEAAQRAENAGATEEEISTAAGLGVLPGVLEAFPPTRIAKRLFKAFGPAADEVAEELSSTLISRIGRKIDDAPLGRITKAGVEEGVQEALSEVGQNLIARNIYDPDQGVFTGTGESAAYGTGIGAIIATLGEAVGLLLPGKQRYGGASPLPSQTPADVAPGQTANMFPETLSGTEPEFLLDVEALEGTSQENPIPVDAPTQLDMIDISEDQQIREMIDAEETAQIEEMIAVDDKAIEAEEASITERDNQIVAQEADAELTEALDDVQRGEDAARIKETKRKRREILTSILDNKDITDVGAAFQAALRRDFATNTSRTRYEQEIESLADASRNKETKKKQEALTDGRDNEIITDVQIDITEAEQALIDREIIQRADNTTSTAELESAIPAAKEPPTVVPPSRSEEELASQNQQREEKSLRNQEQFDATPRLPQGADPNATNVQTEISSIERPENVVAQEEVVEEVVEPDYGPKPVQRILPGAVGYEYEGTPQEPLPLTLARIRADQQAETEDAVKADAALIARKRGEAPVVDTSRQYEPDVAIQPYIDVYGDDIDGLVRVIAYDVSPPIKTTSKGDTKPIDGYTLQTRKAKAAAKWVVDNLSSQAVEKLNAALPAAAQLEIKAARSNRERENIDKGKPKPDAGTQATEEIKEFLNNEIQSGSISQEAVNENLASREFLAKDAVSSSMSEASDAVNTLALDGRTEDAFIQVAEDSLNNRVRIAARNLAKIIGNTKIEFVEGLVDSLGRPAAGAYNRSTNTIELDLDTPLNTHTLLHEGSHAATIKVLDNPSHPVTKKLTNLYNSLQGKITNAYAMESLADFVAEAYTNVKFQVELASFKPNGQKHTAWSRFRNAVAKYLMLSNKPDTADKQAQQYINTILGTSPNTRNATDIANAQANSDPAEAGLASLAGGIEMATPDTIAQSLKGIIAGWTNLSANAQALVLDGWGLEAITDAVKAKLPSAVAFHDFFYKIDGVRTNESARMTTILNSALKAFKIWGEPGTVDKWRETDTEAIKTFNDLVLQSSREGVDPTLSPKQKKERYEYHRVTYGVIENKKRVRQEKYFPTKNAADKEKARQEAQREKAKADKEAGRPTPTLYVIGEVVVTEPDPSKITILRELEALYAQLNNDQKAAYRKIRDEYVRINDLIIEAETNNIDKLDIEKGVQASVKDILFLQRLKYGSVDPYFPLHRDGEYWIEYLFRDANGQVEYGTSSFESVAQQTIALEKYKAAGAEYVEARTADEVQGTMSSGSYNNIPIPFLIDFQAQLKELLDSLPAENVAEKASVSEFMQEAILRSMPEQSIIQSRQNRGEGGRGVVGAERDALMVFQKRMPKLVSSYANLKYQVDISLEARKIAKERATLEPKDAFYSAVADTLIGKAGRPTDKIRGMPSYLEFNKNPHLPEWVRAARSLTFMWTLGANVSSTVVNTSILPIVLLSRLSGEYGPVRAPIAFARASKLYVQTMGNVEVETIRGPEEQFGLMSLTNKKTTTHPDYRLFGPLINRFKEMAYDTRTLGSETSDRESPTGSMLNKFTYYSGLLFSHSERGIRQTSGISVYILEMENLTGKKFDDITQTELDTWGDQAAQHATDTTLWVNASALMTTGSRLSQTGLGSVALQYRRVPAQFIYQQLSMVNAIRKVMLNQAKTPEERLEAKMLARTFLYLTASGFAWIGTQGVPGAGLVTAIYDFFFADEDEDDADTIIAQNIGRAHYGWLATGTLFGFPVLEALSPKIDLTNRINLTNLLIRDPGNYRQNKSPPEVFGETMFGAAGSVFTRVGAGIFRELDSDPLNDERNWEDIFPTALANMFKANRVRKEGYTTRRGDAIVADVGIIDLIKQFFGFTPFEYSYERQKLALQIRKKRGTTDIRTNLIERFIASLGTSTFPADVVLERDTLKAIEAFNERHPEDRIGPSTIRDSMESRAYGDWSAEITGGFATDKETTRRIAEENALMDKAMGM